MPKGDAISGAARAPRAPRSPVRFHAGRACACVSGLMAFVGVAALVATMIHSTGCTEGVCVVPRAAWGARPPRKIVPLATPVDTVIIHHSHIPPQCLDPEQCAEAMRSMQNFHMDERGWDDIGYNFAIGGGDSSAYEGRGWTTHGAHSGPSYNDHSIGIVLIGSYVDVLPTPDMLATCRALIEAGVSKGYVRPNYVLLGHRQVRATECPGQRLYSLIRTWQHWKPVNDSSPS